MMDCVYQTLYKGSDGYVVVCRECNIYQVAFLSSLVKFSAEEYRGFSRQVGQKAKKIKSENTNIKSVILNITSDRFRMILTPAELRDLALVLDHADTEEKTTVLLGLFAD